MDLTSDQLRRITAYLQDWSKDRKFELETSFGAGGVVESNTFLQIAKRLRAKGFEEIPQEDYLNIITPNNIRFTLQGLGILEQYCKDDTMDNKDFTVMNKDRAFAESNLDNREYDFRIKVRREDTLGKEDPDVVRILRQWKTQQKAFRLIRRWSFQGKGVRYDLSMVRQTPSVPGRSDYQWSTTFLQRNVLVEPPRYEVEVELLHGEAETSTPELALKTLIRGIGEVLRAIQKNTLLITKTNRAEVLAAYQNMAKMTAFRGVSPITLELKNMVEKVEDGIPNVRTGYNVTDKADGLRALGYVNSQGELFLLDQSMNVYRTGLQNKDCAESLVDGEWVTMREDQSAINHFLLFDIYHFIGGQKVSQLPFMTVKDMAWEREKAENRYSKLNAWIETWKSGEEVIVKGIANNRLLLFLKHFEFASPGTMIFQSGCNNILNMQRIYHTDGLILTSNVEPLPESAGVRFSQQFKWKPAIDNTVDFLIRFEQQEEFRQDKIVTTVHPTDGHNVSYKIMRLYVGSAKINPRTMILMNEAITSEANSRYKPALFHPTDFPDTMASTCYVPVETLGITMEEYVMTEDSKEPITNESIVEMRYDPSKEPGWRWIPSRIRHDKTERLIRARALANQTGRDIKYKGMMNDEGVANSVWSSIHEPITPSMIRTGNEQPRPDEMEILLASRDNDMGRKYYEKKAPKESYTLIKGLQDFHNKYIKNELLIQTSLKGGNKRLLDVACGKGGDLYKWTYSRPRAAYVVGIDMAGENITNSSDGAYKRYVELIIDMKQRERVPTIAFAIGNSSKNIVDGSAGANQEESNILRSIFGRVAPDGPIPPYIQKEMVGTYRMGADVVACMFALHYFFENEATLNGFLTNVSETTANGGLFIGCCFDGARIFQLLRQLERGRSKTGMEEDTPIWSITKEYDEGVLADDESSIGLAIDVEFLSIGSKHREYLVSFDYFTKRMTDIGFRLLNEKELKELHLSHSTNTFDVSHAMAAKAGKIYPMLPSVQEFSFLNRWFIFKKESEVALPEMPAEAQADAMVEPVPAAEAVPEAVPAAERPSAQRPFEEAEIFRMGPNTTLNIKFKSIFQDEQAGKWMALSAPFSIPDPQDATMVYPSLDHYLVGRKLKLVSNRPEWAKLASTGGTIHQKYLGIRQMEKFDPSWTTDLSIPKPLVGRHVELLEEEAKEIRNILVVFLKKKENKIDESKWNEIQAESGLMLKDQVLFQGLEHRWQNDRRFHEIVEKARNAGKYLLYLTGRKESELGGERIPKSVPRSGKVEGMIEGENKVGKIIMKMAQFPF